jgi:hypothetical protein
MARLLVGTRGITDRPGLPHIKCLLDFAIVASVTHPLAINAMELAPMPVLAIDVLVSRLTMGWSHGYPLGLWGSEFVFLTLAFALLALLVVPLPPLEPGLWEHLDLTWLTKRLRINDGLRIV